MPYLSPLSHYHIKQLQEPENVRHKIYPHYHSRPTTLLEFFETTLSEWSGKL